MKKAFMFLTLITACVCLGSAETKAADRIFVLMPNAQGQSTDPTHLNWIDAYAVDFNLVKPATGAPTAPPVAFLKGADKASPLIIKALVTPLDQGIVKIEMCGIPPSGGPDRCYFKIELGLNDSVTDFHLTESTCSNPTTCTPVHTESVTISYAQLRTTFVSSNGAATTTCWNFAINRAC